MLQSKLLDKPEVSKGGIFGNDKGAQNLHEYTMNLVSRKLDGSEKKTLEKNILDYLCVGNEIVFCRYEGDNVNVYQYPNHKLLFSVNDSDEDLYYLGDILFCRKEYVAFQGDLDLGYISVYNLKTGEWKEYFNMCNTRDEFYYKRTDVQCIEGNIFIQGVMCDSTKSSLGGEYYTNSNFAHRF